MSLRLSACNWNHYYDWDPTSDAPATVNYNIPHYLYRFYCICTFCNEGSDVFIVVVTKSPIFWDITPCSPVESQQTFQRNMSLPSPSFRRWRQMLVGWLSAVYMAFYPKVLQSYVLICRVIYQNIFVSELLLNKGLRKILLIGLVVVGGGSGGSSICNSRMEKVKTTCITTSRWDSVRNRVLMRKLSERDQLETVKNEKTMWYIDIILREIDYETGLGSYPVMGFGICVESSVLILENFLVRCFILTELT
jgi:hypothetical protein